MRSLPDRKLTEDEYKELKKKTEKYRNSRFAGSEAVVIPDSLPGLATKLFNEESIKQGENKLNKLSWLYKRQQELEKFSFPLHILSTVSYKGELKGYDTESDYYNESLASICLLTEEKIFCLEKVKENLKFLHEIGAIFGDVYPSNILINRKNINIVGFYDWDNIQIENTYPIDTVNIEFLSFIQNGWIEEDVDRYMYNLMVLNELEENLKDYDETLKGQYSWNHTFQVLDESARETLLKLNSASTKYKSDYLIDHVKVKKK